MKNTILTLFCTFLGVIMMVLIMVMYGRLNRSIELKHNLSSSIEETIENTMLTEKYKVTNNEEMVADFLESLVYSCDAKSDMQVDILQCDRERGILSVSVTLSYLHPNGREGSIKTDKTVIYNQKPEDAQKSYKVSFLIGEDCYKIFEVCENSVISVPVQPEIEGKSFYGWVDLEGEKVDFSIPIRENATYYADIR